VEDNRLSYLFLGMGIGVAIGVLFAPKAGEETRRLIRDKADEGRDFVKRRADEARGSAEEIVERGKGAVERQKDQLSAAVEAGKQAYRDTVVPDAGAPKPEVEGV